MLEKQDHSIGELFAQLGRETSTLVRQEVALAKVELTEKASRAGKDVGRLAVGGAVGYAALLASLAALIILLANRRRRSGPASSILGRR